MWLDNLLSFSNAQSLIGVGNTASTNVIDITGGQSMNIGTASTFGTDYGIGDTEEAPDIVVTLPTGFTTGTGATLNIAFQTSTDSVTFTTAIETGAIPAASLTIGSKLTFKWPVRQVNAVMGRYVRLLYQIPSGTFTAGSISATVSLNADKGNVGAFPAAY